MQTHTIHGVQEGWKLEVTQGATTIFTGTVVSTKIRGRTFILTYCKADDARDRTLRLPTDGWSNSSGTFSRTIQNEDGASYLYTLQEPATHRTVDLSKEPPNRFG